MIGTHNNEQKPTIGSEIVDVQRDLHIITQSTRGAIVLDILGHPKGMPTLKELDYMNPDKSPSTIQDHLEVLEQHGLVEKLQIPVGERQRDLPNTFFALTPKAEELLEKHDLFLDELDRIQEVYSSIDKPPDVQQYEEAPRPNKMTAHV